MARIILKSPYLKPGGTKSPSANQHIRRRNSIDRKQRQKIEEKKQALGQRSSGYEYDYNEKQTM